MGGSQGGMSSAIPGNGKSRKRGEADSQDSGSGRKAGCAGDNRTLIREDFCGYGQGVSHNNVASIAQRDIADYDRFLETQRRWGEMSDKRRGKG